MSIELIKEYCTDVKSLYEGLDRIYNEIVLKSGILFKITNGQTQFIISSLKNTAVKNAIENDITYFVDNFMKNDLYTTFKEIDKNFKLTATPSPKKLNICIGNEKILSVMEKYAEAILSPEYRSATVVSKKIEPKEEKTVMEIAEIETAKNNIPLEYKKNYSEKNKISGLKSIWEILWSVCALISLIVLICLISWVA